MALLTWNHACGVGVRAMDDQHGILMDTMNEVRQAIVRGCNREQLSELLDRLIEFTRMHFSSEEKLMEQGEFPGLADHRAEHQRLLASLIGSVHRVQHGEQVHMSAQLNILRDSFIEHIEDLDRQYGAWLNECGIN